jgi:hypothetical protein
MLGLGVLVAAVLSALAGTAASVMGDGPSGTLLQADAIGATSPETTATLQRIAPDDVVSRAIPDGRAVGTEVAAAPVKNESSLKDKADKLRRQAQKQSQAAADAVFKVGSLNVLGASHSDGGNAGRFANGADRTRLAAAKIRALGISVIGLQEYEPENHNAFVGATGWGVFPGMSMGIKGVRNSIAWNPSVWTLLETHTSTFPYFRGQPVPLPYVLLEHQATGQKAWFISIHNPVSNKQRGQNQKWRDIATAKEAALMSSLRANTGYPVFLTGDFNERSEAYYKVTAGGRAVAASGGLTGSTGIDWIFGTPDVLFSGYVRDNSTIGHISDHPLVYATATLSGD